MKQKNTISDESRHESNSHASAPEHAPKMQYDKINGVDSKVDNDWIKPKNCAPMTYFFKKYKNEEEIAKVSIEHSALIDENDNDDEEEHEMKHCNVKKEVSCSDVKMNEDNEKITKATKNNGAADRDEMMSNDNEKLHEKLSQVCKEVENNMK